MRAAKSAFLFGAILGLTGVVLGALGAHALETRLTADQLESWQTATRFQMYHAISLLVLGFLNHQFPNRLLRWAGIAMTLGTLCFSGSIYLLVLTDFPVALLTPLGGTILIAAWGLLIFWAANFKSS